MRTLPVFQMGKRSLGKLKALLQGHSEIMTEDLEVSSSYQYFKFFVLFYFGFALSVGQLYHDLLHIFL